MIKKPVVLISLLLACMAMLFTVGAAYSLYSKKQHDIDPKVDEISGIEFDKRGRLWAINDSGDGPKLYMLNDDGTVAREVTVTNARNIDWEDMTQNEFGHFFLGDFGNNENKRRWLTIYKIENPIDIKTDTTEAEIIKFTYPEMDGKPIEPHRKNFDLEAFIEFDRNLYLFTKNRTAPFDGITNVYKVGDHADNFNAQKIDAFKTCTTLEKLCWITSAAISPDRKKLVLLDSTSIWLFENFPGDRFFSGDIYRIDLGLITQKEAVTFYDNNTLIFTDEAFKGLIGGNAYKIELDKVAKQPIQTSSPSNLSE